jgi:rod shape-determining protein MreC
VAIATRRANQNITLLIVVLVAITVLTLDYHGEASKGITKVRNGIADVLGPVQRGVASAIHPIGDVVSGAFHYRAAQRDIERLQAEVATLSRTGAQSSYEMQQSRLVLSLDHLRDATGVPSVIAPVLLDSPSNFEQTIELGIGTSSGVGPGMPVEDAGGLVGSVVSAGRTTSTVLLITDRRSSVDVRFGVAGAASGTLLAGQGPGRPLAGSPVSGIPVHRGEVVLTSGLAGADYPAGIPVGTVQSVVFTTGGLAEHVTVAPAVRPSDLQYVAVMLWTPSA